MEREREREREREAGIFFIIISILTHTHGEMGECLKETADWDLSLMRKRLGFNKNILG